MNLFDEDAGRTLVARLINAYRAELREERPVKSINPLHNLDRVDLEAKLELFTLKDVRRVERAMKRANLTLAALTEGEG